MTNLFNPLTIPSIALTQSHSEFISMFMHIFQLLSKIRHASYIFHMQILYYTTELSRNQCPWQITRNTIYCFQSINNIVDMNGNKQFAIKHACTEQEATVAFACIHIASALWWVNITMALSSVVCEIFNVDKCCDLEIGVWGHSRSLKMVPLDILHMISY